MFGAPPQQVDGGGDIPEVAARDIGFSETGTRVSFATSHHEAYKPNNVVDK